MEDFMSKDKMKDEQISFAEAKEFLNKVHDDLVDLLEQNKLMKAIECILLKILFILCLESITPLRIA